MKTIGVMSGFFFSARLAWRQLTYERSKLVAATLGVLFACVLVFMQMGFRDALYASISKLPKYLSGELFIMHKQTEALWRTVPFDRAQAYRAFSHPAVEKVIPLYIGQAQWKNPETRVKRTLLLFGSEPNDAVFSLPEAAGLSAALARENTIAFDTLSRPEFGPIDQLLAQGPLTTEVNDRKLKVIGTFKLGASFAADGNALISEQNFLRVFPSRGVANIDVGVLRLSPGSDIQAVQKALQQVVDEDVYVFTKDEIAAYEFAYWQNNAPIGFIFGFGMVMGLVVGMVIVYQILFTDITNHLSEFATLKAMGYSHFYLLQVVFASSVLLALVGFLPGLAISAVLYKLAESIIFIPMPLPLSKMLTVFGMILIMCMLSGSLAMRKMRGANPADMF